MFITFEGIDGSGKTTILELLSQEWREQKRDFLLTREPGGSVLGEDLRTLLLSPQKSRLSKEAELFLFLADRAEHVAQVIRPALEKGRIVLCDRYTDSTLVFQGYARGFDLALLRSLNDCATNCLEADATLLFDLPCEMALERLRNRREKAGEESRIDAEKKAFHEKVREGYLAEARRRKDRFYCIDASRTIPEVLASTREIINTILKK